VDGWAYVATVIDLHSRKVVGYAVADHLRTSLIIEALAAALVTRRPPAGRHLPQRPRNAIHQPGIRRLLRRQRRRPLDGPPRHLFR
jgi:transposase InsO family protein